MKTKTVVSRSGGVKVVNAVSTFSKILNEISVNGQLDCQMVSTEEYVSFVFNSNGVQVTCHVQEMPVRKGVVS